MPPKKDAETKTQEPEKRGKRNAGKEKPADTKIKQDGSENGEEPVKRSLRKAAKDEKTENVNNLKVTNGGPTKKVIASEEQLESEEAPKAKASRKPKAAASETTDKPFVAKRAPKRTAKKEEDAEELEEDLKEDEIKVSDKSKKKEIKENNASEEPVENKKRRGKGEKADSPGPPEKSRKKNAKEDKKDAVKPSEKTTKKTKGEEDKPAAAKKKRATKTKSNEAEEKEPMNKTGSNWKAIDFTCTKKNAKGQTFNLKVSTWNIGGVKAWVKKGCHEYLQHERPDIFCIQETKSNEDNLPKEITEIKDYEQYWCSSDKNGYAGVALFTLKSPIGVSYGINDKDMDEDGRCITAEFDDYYVVCVYVPNAGRKLVTLPKRLEWNEKFKKYIKELDEKKPVILCGDMNVSHQEIDLARPKNNTKNAGFTKEERDGMTDFLKDGFVDTWRTLYPDKDAYTFWTYMSNARANNVGWRLDYFIVSERIMESVCDNVIRSDVFGSDHCPVTLFLHV